MKLEKIAIIGAGTMGSGIAQKLAQDGFQVVLHDREERFLEAGRERIRSTLEQAVERKLFTQDQVSEIEGRIQGTTDLRDASDADLVVEAIYEDLAAKQGLFEQLDAICRPDAILASNTSSFLVSQVMERVRRPERCLGLHYFFHPAKNRLLEVIPGPKTNPETVAAGQLFGKMHGKITILCKDSPGFVVNRFFIPWYLAAFRLLEEGVAGTWAIETVARDCFRIGMGPFTLVNVTGPAVAYHAALGLASTLGDFYAPPANIKELSESGGQWEIREGEEISEETRAAIQDRILGAVFTVAATLVEEGGARIEDVDRGAKVALRWSMGPFELMNRVGIDQAGKMVRRICDRHGLPFPGILEKQRGPFHFQFVDLKIEGPVAHITINRPEAGNALNPELVAQLEECFDRAEKTPGVRSIVFRGTGKTFVAGADIRFFLKNMKAGNIDAICAFSNKGSKLFRRFETSAKRTIVVLDGPSLGGGSEMVLAAQVVVATQKGALQFPETGLGIYPGLGGTQRLTRMLGPGLARYYLFTGTPISAGEAKELGLVHEVVEPQDLDRAIEKLALAEEAPARRDAASLESACPDFAAPLGREDLEAMLAASFDPGGNALLARAYRAVGRKAPVALRMVEKLIRAAGEMDMEAGLETEQEWMAEIFVTRDAYEGLSKVGRGRPDFQGK